MMGAEHSALSMLLIIKLCLVHCRQVWLHKHATWQSTLTSGLQLLSTHLRQDVLQGVNQGDVHLIANCLDHTRVVNWVVHQALQLREL